MELANFRLLMYCINPLESMELVNFGLLLYCLNHLESMELVNFRLVMYCLNPLESMELVNFRLVVYCLIIILMANLNLIIAKKNYQSIIVNILPNIPYTF